jgi:CRP-like cAMP-binding protein
LISKIPFLKDKVPQFVADIISMFQPMVFQEGDFVCKEGTQADEMYFLLKGKAGIYYGQKLVVVIEEGSYFGEIGCIMGGIRRAGVKALSTCELQALSRRNLNILLAEYPEVGEELKKVAKDRAQKMQSHQ